MTKPLCFLALICLSSLQLVTITHAQTDLDWALLGNEEEWTWGGEEECYWAEEEEWNLGDIAIIDNPVPAGQAANCETQYTIVQGDICDTLATNNGISVQDLQNLNQGLDCANLQIGQNICVKGASGDGTADPPVEGGGEGGEGGEGQANVSFEQFAQAVSGVEGAPAPSQDQYNSFINNYASAGGIESTRELAMFLAEILHESGGLIYKREIACQDTGCPDEYRTEGDAADKFYYGRGYIQLTWSDNYRAASQDLFGDDSLVQNPDLVADNEDIAWQTAFWYWKTRVGTDPNVKNGQFGSATAAINGALECPCNEKCQSRNTIYAHVLQAFGVNEEPNLNGC